MSFIYTVLIGLAAGAVAKLIMPGKDPGGWIVTTVLGIAGAIVAKYLGQLVGLYAEGETAGFIGAVVGAVILLGAYRLVTKSRKS
ncbi:MAG: ymgE [candidate division NC10 bacterium]|nr:ymgE [candidate division NC10 bacterium]